MSERTYRISDATAVTRRGVNIVKKWIDDDLLQLPQASTRRAWRTFTRFDLLQITAIAEISNAGLRPNRDTSIWHLLFEVLRDLDQGKNTPEHFVVVMPGRGALVTSAELFADLIAKTGHIWAFNAAAIHARFVSRLEGIG